MAHSKFIVQGLVDNNDHYAALVQLFNLPNINRCLISTAFANLAGINLLIPNLRQLKDVLTIYVGIRNGISSKQAITLLLENDIHPFCVDTATQAYIFHPKVFLSTSDQYGKLIVGSANLTGGGLVRNIEASIIMDLDFSTKQDLALSNSIFDSYNHLVSSYPENIFRVTDFKYVQELTEAGLLEDESKHIIKSISKLSNPTSEKRKRMVLKTRELRTVQKSRHYSKELDCEAGSLNSKPVINKDLLWISNPLSRRDLNIPDGANTNRTGSMFFNLGDRTQAINFQHYFRDEAFANAKWEFDKSPGKTHYERSEISFRIIIKGIDHGIHKLRISHNTNTASAAYKQKNSMTQLHWGRTVRPMIAREDLLGGRMYLYAPEENSDIYTLSFDAE